VEDINRDNTMNTINAYYEYCIDNLQMAIGQNYITDIRNTQVSLPDGTTTEAKSNLKSSGATTEMLLVIYLILDQYDL
jgi:cell surface protein SprA